MLRCTCRLIHIVAKNLHFAGFCCYAHLCVAIIVIQLTRNLIFSGRDLVKGATRGDLVPVLAPMMRFVTHGELRCSCITLRVWERGVGEQPCPLVHGCVAIGAGGIFSFNCCLVQYGVIVGLHDLFQAVLSAGMPIHAVVYSQTSQVVKCLVSISGTVICGWDPVIWIIYGSICLVY